MLITFRSKAGGNVTMFGDVAIRLLKMAGHTGTVPSALLASEIPEALQRLKQAVAADRGEAVDGASANDADPESPPPVELPVRAYPLIQLLSAAADQKCDVVWDEDRPLFPGKA